MTTVPPEERAKVIDGMCCYHRYDGNVKIRCCPDCKRLNDNQDCEAYRGK